MEDQIIMTLPERNETLYVPPPIARVPEIARYLRVRPNHVYAMFAQGEIPGGKRISRSPREQYMALPYSMVHSDAWRGLSGRAVKTWIELRSRYNGKNDGQLHLSLEEGARLLHMSKATVHRAFKELETKGFVHLVTESHRGGRRAREYAATYPGDRAAADADGTATGRAGEDVR